MDDFSYMALGTVAIIGATALMSNIDMYERVREIAKTHSRHEAGSILDAFGRPGSSLWSGFALARKVYGI